MPKSEKKKARKNKVVKAVESAGISPDIGMMAVSPESKKKVVKEVVDTVVEVPFIEVRPTDIPDDHEDSHDYGWILKKAEESVSSTEIIPDVSESPTVQEEEANFKVLKEEAELNELKAIEEATSKMQQAAVKQRKRNYKPITLKITGDTLLRWHAMIEGMRASLLNRAGVTAAEKAVYSKIPINDATALEYLLTLHDEETERREAKRLPLTAERRQETPEEENAMLTRAQKKRPEITSQNPKSMLSQSPPLTLPKMGSLFKDERFTVGGNQLSEADFFRIAASKKPPKKVKKGM